jgi:hypothetical protein
MKNWALLCVGFGLLAVAGRSFGAEAAPGLKVTTFVHNHSSVERLAKYESVITLNKSWKNPYDPVSQVELTAYFQQPDGGVSKVSGFWHEDFTRSLRANKEQLEATTVNGWMFRFAPRSVGVFKYYIEVIDRENGGSALRYPAKGFLSFTSTPSAHKGFLKVSKIDHAYLEFEDGSPYVGLGHNVLGWEWSGNDNSPGTYDYDRWLTRMAKSGANLAQFDLSGTDQLEWTAYPSGVSHTSAWEGLGRYNQQVAWKFDHIISQAEHLGIFFRFCFSHWGDYDLNTRNHFYRGWNRNPYNAANGGPVANVTEFFADAKAREYYKRFLRYVVARWGYSKNILTYELWNEADAPHMSWGAGHNYKSNQANLLDWHREMSDYLKSIDPHHLVTTSFANNLNQPSIWELPNMDLTTIHRYPVFNERIDGGFPKWEVEECLTYLIRKRAAEHAKPVLIGEFTVSPYGQADTHNDPTGIAFHNQLWVSIMQGSLGTAMMWQWGYYIDAFDLYYHYRPLATFLDGEDLSNMTAFSYKNGAANGYGRKNAEKAYLWVHDAKHTFIDRDYSHEVIAGQRCDLDGMDDGTYRISLFDPYAGKVLSEHTLTSAAGKLTVPLPDFRKDIAIKAKKLAGR